MVGSNVSLGGTNVITNGKIISTAQPSGSILQVVQTIKRDTWSVTSPASTWTDISGMSATITPSSINSRILIMFTVYHGISVVQYSGGVRVVRGSSVILPSLATGPTALGHSSSVVSYIPAQGCDTNTLIDTPSSTSALTYKLQFVHENTNTTWYLNTPGSITNDGRSVGTVSTLTLMEVAG